MNITSRFANVNGSREQHLNKLLAQEIVTNCDLVLMDEIVSVLSSNVKVDIIADALKVTEIVGESSPELARSTYPIVMKLLDHQSNKIQWRAMSALSTFGHLELDVLFNELGKILQLMDAGSIITRDHGIKIMIGLYQKQCYREDLASLLEEQMLTAPDNQLGQYAEKWLEVITLNDLPRLRQILENRLPDLTNPSHQKRISRVLKKLNKYQSS